MDCSALGRPAEAEELFERARVIEDNLGLKEDPAYISAIAGLGMARLAAESAQTASQYLEQAASLLAKVDDGSANYALLRGRTNLALSQALWRSGSRSPRIEELVRLAGRDFEAARAEENSREADAWLVSCCGSRVR